jgi:iron complex outermembrane receptor protein
VYGTFPLPPLPDMPEVVTKVRRFGVLVQDQMKIDDRWVVVAGLRRDKASTSIEGTSPAQKDMATSVNLGAVWLAGAWSPYINYSESFEPVAGTDFAGNLFKPQSGKQLEGGVKWQALDRLNASAAIYELREKNRLASDPDHVGFSVQRGEVTVKGLELELAGQVASWDLTAQYTYTDAQITRTGNTPEELATLGQQLEAIPKHGAGVWAVHRFAAAPGLRAGFGVRYVGESGDGLAGGLEVPAVTLFDAMVSYEIPGWRFALNANNLTDKKYVASCLGRGDCWYGNRRRAFASVTHIF